MDFPLPYPFITGAKVPSWADGQGGLTLEQVTYLDTYQVWTGPPVDQKILH